MRRKSIVLVAALPLGIGVTGYPACEAGDDSNARPPSFSAAAAMTQDDAAAPCCGASATIDPEVLSHGAGGAVWSERPDLE